MKVWILKFQTTKKLWGNSTKTKLDSAWSKTSLWMKMKKQRNWSTISRKNRQSIMNRVRKNRITIVKRTYLRKMKTKKMTKSIWKVFLSSLKPKITIKSPLITIIKDGFGSFSLGLVWSRRSLAISQIQWKSQVSRKLNLWM